MKQTEEPSVSWLLTRAREIDPEAWGSPLRGRHSKRRSEAMRKAKEEWDSRTTSTEP